MQKLASVVLLAFLVLGGACTPGDEADPDAGRAPLPNDAGQTHDAGQANDAGQTADAGHSSDAGQTNDAGQTADAGQTNDAGQSTDAGQSADAGQTNDAGQPTDAGQTAVTRVRVHYAADTGDSIHLRGDGAGLSWESDSTMVEESPGVWVWQSTTVVTPLELKPVHRDSQAALSWPAGANWTVAPGETIDLEPFFFGESGTVSVVDVPSSVYGGTRTVAVYTPPGYDDPGAATREYPVLVMHDGQNLFDAQLASFGVEWEIDEALDSLTVGGYVHTTSTMTSGVRELIVVAPFNTADRIYELTPTNASFDTCVAPGQDCGGGGDQYLDFVEDDLLPWAHSALRINDERPGIMGSSLGGLISMYACWSRPTVYGRCGVFSPSLWWDDGWMIDQVSAYGGAKKPLTIYLDNGSAESGAPDTVTLDTLLGSKGYTTGDDLLCLMGAGQAHNESAWQTRAPWALLFLYPDPHRVTTTPAPPGYLGACN